MNILLVDSKSFEPQESGVLVESYSVGRGIATGFVVNNTKGKLRS